MTDPLLTADPVEAARHYLTESAFTAGPVGRVGLELELHLIDLHHPGRRPQWDQVQRLVAALPVMPSGSAITVEPGGQLELSTPPEPDVAAAVRSLAADRSVLATALSEAGYGGAPLGTDLARRPQRINPAPRYRAMEEHFSALGCAPAASHMMTSTAALQVNLDAGPAHGWAQRLDLAHLLGPVMISLSSTSPYVGGATSGWHSMRQAAWLGLDPARTKRFSSSDPDGAWASYALAAPVMAVHDGATTTGVTERVSFEDWLSGLGPVTREPRLEDLDFHISTLFPPVRPRGYLELRYLDALPDQWWPAVAGVVATLMDDPTAADLAADACEPVRDVWQTAARDGLGDRALRRAALTCLEIAAAHGPPSLRAPVEELADLTASGHSLSDVIRRRVESDGPIRVLQEESHA
ncbi:hypothetical protein VV02_12400 [Luteipulveratus mongoliensis]|uniref:Glutamate--cysteine ligase EgtA n=1 Tax=Luteipulveratus mongoliensis TaxID=571913 RepID=A0A0K1JQ70_9MICO|nr:hypothetical protein VV02_12400 [Luteipulveratus mongoliensis]